ncbi:MAG: CHAP domain-containing protein [Verrucomicrobiaceae bacterium]|nr:MAG: CHAP domain-containing protein [Verrucomicrobiaceae bacterium]
MKSLLPILLSAATLPLLPSCAPAAKPEPQPAGGQPSASRSAGSNAAIVEYCRRNNGRKVGDGECWTLANEAFKATGKRRPGADNRVWGRVVNYQSEGVRPGDIIEFQSALFPGYITGSKHTAIVAEGGKGDISIAEQNMMGSRKVSFRSINLNSKISGKVTVYRPQ